MISANDKIEPGILKLQSVARPPLVAGFQNCKPTCVSASFIPKPPKDSLRRALLFATAYGGTQVITGRLYSGKVFVAA